MPPENARDLLKADPKGTKQYRRFSLAHLTAYCVYWLTQWGIPTTYENAGALNPAPQCQWRAPSSRAP
jgi:hypothetical protein